MRVVDPEGAEIRAMDRLVDFDGKDVLEIGCGDGRLTWRYAHRTRSVLAIDPVEKHIATAKAAIPKRLRNTVEFRVADVTTDLLPSRTYDLAILSWSL